MPDPGDMRPPVFDAPHRLGEQGRRSVFAIGFVPAATPLDEHEADWLGKALKARDMGLSKEEIPRPPSHRWGKRDERGVDDARARGRALDRTLVDEARRRREEMLADADGMLPLSTAGPLDRLERDSNCRPILPWHQTSTGRAGVLTTLVAGSGAPVINGPVLGVDLFSGELFRYDAWGTFDAGLTRSPDMFVSGMRGNGKSFFCKTLAVREIEFGRHVIVQSDRQGEWTRLARAIGGQVVSPGAGVCMNPFDLPEVDAQWAEAHGDEWAQEVRVSRRGVFRTLEEALPDRDGYKPLGPAHEAIIDRLVASFGTGPMTLAAAVERLGSREWIDAESPSIPGFAYYPDKARELAADCARVFSPMTGEGPFAGMFDRESSVRLDPKASMIVFDTSSPLFENAQLKHVYTACVSAWIDRLLQRRDGLRRIVVIEEAWDVVSNPGLLDSLQTRQRSAGHWGCATWLIVHGASDLSNVFDRSSGMRGKAEMLMQLMETKVTFQQDDLGVLSEIIPDMTEDEREMTPRLKPGVCIVRIGHEHPRLVTALAGATMARLFDTSGLRKGT